MGAAIFVRHSKHFDLLFASVQRTFTANSRSVEQTLNKTFARVRCTEQTPKSMPNFVER